MEIKAKIDRVIHSGKVKAIASVTLDDQFVVKNLRVVDGSKGLFVAFPQETYTDKSGNKHYSNIFFPTTNSGKYDMENAVLNAYRVSQNQSQNPDRGYGFVVEDDTSLGMQM